MLSPKTGHAGAAREATAQAWNLAWFSALGSNIFSNVPFVLVARARNWSRPRTLAITVFAGLGHIALTSLLGLAIAWFGLMGAVMLSLIGLMTSLWAEKFDHNAAVTNFVIQPLSLLSGTFYVIENLHGVFQAVSRANPFFYVISGFRYGFLGASDIGAESHGQRRGRRARIHTK